MAFTRRETTLLVGGDIALLVFSLWSALAVRALQIPSFLYFERHLIDFIPVFAFSLLVFFIAGLYEKQTRVVRSTMGGRILGAQIANVVIAAVFFFVLPFAIAPKTILALYLFISVILISLWRFYVTPSLVIRNRVQAILVGQGPAVRETFDEVNLNNKYRLATHINTIALSSHSVAEQVQAAIKTGIRAVVIDTRDPAVTLELPALYHAMLTGVSFFEFAAFYESIFDRVPVAHVDHAWLLECLPKKRFAYDIGKRFFEVIGALIGLVIATPFVIIAALLILLTTKGNPFIFHDRVGQHGKTFRIVKLRTMLFDDHGDRERQKLNRVTVIGKFLRKSRIDELPQLWNILTGELSFIGPRPELPKIAETYKQEIPFYDVRHLVTPGLSGWAQLRDLDPPKGAADIMRTERKLSYDLYYVKHRSFPLDVIIALKTARALVSFSGK
jgi:lipopolysaccharide/colanic/teichoic acid biosynthesis glycosyltransferase